MIKKYLPLLFFGLIFTLPTATHAGLSEACFPSVECDPGEDYYENSCQPHIESVALDCPAPPPGEFAAFSCDYGCYNRTTPDSETCPGGVMVEGVCLTTLYLVDDQDTEKIWDGQTLKNFDGDSLWSLNGSSVYYDGGNVGIGTDTPAVALEVVGVDDYAFQADGIAQTVNAYPIKVIDSPEEAPGSRVGIFKADNAGNFIHVGSQSNHDFSIVTNSQRRITVTNLGDIGIGKITPTFGIDANTSMNLDGDASAGILYSSGAETIWYAGDYFIWGSGGNSNYFPKRVSIGSDLGTSAAQLSVTRTGNGNASSYGIYNNNTTNTGTGTTFGVYNLSKNLDSGSSYGIMNSTTTSNGAAYAYFSSATSEGEANGYGGYNYAYLSQIANTKTAYGLYTSAYNVSSSCAGLECGDAYGVYATTGNSTFGTGIYGEGRYFGVHAVGRSGGNSIGLMVENKQSGATGSLFTCTGSCTSAVFRDGNDASPGVFESGVVIIGMTNGEHLALDGNEIMAKDSGNTAGTLYINKDGNGDVEINMAHNSFASSVCRSGEVLGYCASLRDKKKNIAPIEFGLDTVMQMNPVSFDWKEEDVRDGMRDIGFIAEDAEAISPILAEYSDGKLTGFKYRQFTAVLTKAIQEQQNTIEELKAIVCLDHPDTDLCKN